MKTIKRLLILGLLVTLVPLLISCQKQKRPEVRAPQKAPRQERSLAATLKTPDPLKRDWSANLDFEPIKILARRGRVFVLGNKPRLEEPASPQSSLGPALSRLADLFRPKTALAKGMPIEGGVVEAYDQKSGGRLWRRYFAGQLPPYNAGAVVHNGAITRDGLLINRSEKSKGTNFQIMRLMLLDFTTGGTTWTAPFTYFGHPQPVVQGSTVIFAAKRNPALKPAPDQIAKDAVVAYDLKTRQIKWRYPARAWDLRGRDNRLYFYNAVNDKETVAKPVALNSQDGKRLWARGPIKHRGELFLNVGRQSAVATQLIIQTRGGQARQKASKTGRKRKLYTRRFLSFDGKTGAASGSFAFRDLSAGRNEVGLIGIIGARGEDRLVLAFTRNRQEEVAVYSIKGKRFSSFLLNKEALVESYSDSPIGPVIQVRVPAFARPKNMRQLKDNILLVNLDDYGRPKHVWDLQSTMIRTAGPLVAVDKTSSRVFVTEFKAPISGVPNDSQSRDPMISRIVGYSIP